MDMDGWAGKRAWSLFGSYHVYAFISCRSVLLAIGLSSSTSPLGCFYHSTTSDIRAIRPICTYKLWHCYLFKRTTPIIAPAESA